MYDLRTGEWTRVVGIPATDHPPVIRYVTADGFAAYQDEYVSVEGVVDDEGRFVSEREVPVGHGIWSPDRSWFVEMRPEEGVIVRPATDLTTGQVLDLPIKAEYDDDNLQWESRNSVLVSVGDGGYRCDVRSGSCQILGRDGDMARGNFWEIYGVYG